MLSKCANPECSEVLRYLHQGKIFHLFPSPAVEAATLSPAHYERFWLCGQCSQEMTLVWGGTQVKLVPLAAKPAPQIPPEGSSSTRRRRARAASAGREDR